MAWQQGLLEVSFRDFTLDLLSECTSITFSWSGFICKATEVWIQISSPRSAATQAKTV